MFWHCLFTYKDLIIFLISLPIGMDIAFVENKINENEKNIKKE